MKHANPKLIALWIAAGLTILVGSISAFNSLTGLNRQASLWQQKISDKRELTRLLDQSRQFKVAVEAHKAWPSSPTPLQDLLLSTLPGIAISPLSSVDQPSVENWTARRVTFSMTDVPGEALDKFFQAASTSCPPWSVEECTLQSSVSSGRLARVDLIMVAVERTASGN